MIRLRPQYLIQATDGARVLLCLEARFGEQQAQFEISGVVFVSGPQEVEAFGSTIGDEQIV